MNADRFRLVYSQCLGMFVPVSETTKAQGRKSSGKRMRSRYAVTAALFSISYSYNAIAAPPLVNALPTAGVVAAGVATIYTPVSTSAMTVNQATQNAIINWGSFNIGAQASVDFKMPNSTSQVLNRISATGGLSQIYGKMTANGQVYLINPNGILFGSGAQVNVNSLVASSLNISDDLFNKGLLTITNGTPNFSGTTGYIQVNAGAKINAATGGKVLMFAPNIKNNGIISTPEGQTLLAAGQKIYLTGSDDPNLRGLLVEIDNGGTVNNGFTEVDEKNQPIQDKVNVGQIIAERGNVTLAGIAVNQNGRVKATTSVSANGSIKLQAQDKTVILNPSDDIKKRVATVAGDVTLGKNSITEVLPDATDKLAVADAVAVNKSKMAISGKNIHLMDNAMIIAPSGDVNLTAKLDPSKDTPSTLTAPNKSRIYFESGSGIDVSGVGSGSTAPDRVGEKAAQVSVVNNVVLAELRATELRDSPLQRTGILYKAKVYADSRATGINGDVGTSVVDVSGYTKQITHGLSERLATGGSANVVSEGDIVFKPTATINISGGKVDYTAATVKKTRLLASNGQTYDIANASKELTYVGIQTVSVQEQGYTDGKNAGSVAFIAPAMVLEGKVSGSTIVGERQRSIASRPIGATLQVGDSLRRLQSNLLLDASHQAAGIPLFDKSLSSEQQQTLLLGANFTAPSGFNNLLYYAGGQITVKNGTNLAVNSGGNITLDGGGVDIQSNLTAHAGTINVSAKEGINNASGNAEIGSTSTLDVSGLWTNDRLNLAARDVVAVDGGKINISASSQFGANGDVILGKGSVINASGGAWLNASGKLKSGKGGDIKLLASDSIKEDQHTGKLKLDGTLRADSLATGGSLSLSSGSVTIGGKALNTIGETLIDRTLFEKGGFTSYDINGFEGLTLADNTNIAPTEQTRVLDSGFSVQQSGTDITNFSHLSLLPATNAAQTRKATSVSLSASSQFNGRLNLGLGSTIVVDPGSTVNLLAKRQLTVLGSIIAPAGNINMTSGVLSGEKSLETYKNDHTLWLGKNSVLDVSGIVDSFTNTNGFKVGPVKDAGTIKLNATKGEVVAEAGSQLKLNGTHAILDVKSGNSFIAKDIASKGGSLSISAREGILWDATMHAKGGNETVAAGNLTIALPLLDIGAVNETNGGLVPADQYPIGPREIVLKATGTSVPAGLKPSDSIDVANNGIATIFVDKLQNAGFDNIQFAKSNNIRFAENINLTTRGSLTLDTPNVIVNDGVKATLNASFVSMGNSQGLYQESPTVDAPVGGTGTLAVNAEYIDLYGKQSLSGVDKKVNGAGGVDIISKGDIQLRGVTAGNNPSNTNLAGGLNTVGDMTLSAKRIYPSTLSNYTLSTTGADSTIAFKSSGADSGVPFSVLGTLNVEASNITQDGVLRAPFGVIDLKAINQLTLGNGSLTSVSAEGKTLPFGTTINAKTLNFDVGDNRIAIITTLAEKNINLDGKLVTAASGSKIDISGSGDLSAYEFTTGTGGSDDVLAASGVFAVLPSLKAGYMAGNSESYGNSTFKAGDSIYLSGGNGLAAGNYVLLPAHYALLPGGYSVKTVAGTQDFSVPDNVINRDGSQSVSGYRTQFGGITKDSRSSGFLVASGAIARTQSEYTNTLASKFFNKPDSAASGLRLPADAGRVAINAVTSLVLDGTLVANHAAQTRGAAVDISSDKIAISGDGSKDADASYLTLSSAKLNSFGAESLTIGGKRKQVAEGTQLEVTASNVKLIGGASLTGQEITLAATDTVSMATGTSVNATGAAAKNSGMFIIGNTEVAGSGDGALLRVSTGAQPDLVRKNVSQTKGSLDIKTGAKVSGASVIADATKANSVNGEITSAKDGAIRLGAPNISFGAPTASVSGLLLDNTKLAALGSPSNIQLKSYSTIDFYGATTVGDANLKSLTFESAGLKGFSNAGSTVTLTADTVKFTNPDNVKFESASQLGSGTLAVNAAKEIKFGSGTFATAGFATVQLKADQVIGEGKGGLSVTGNLAIDAGRITAAGLSDQTIKASGSLITAQHAAIGLAKAPLGGKLTLDADTITHGGLIDLPSGNVTLKAAGKAGGDSVILLTDSQINARGSAQLLGTVTALADGGTVKVQTANGNVRMEKGAIIDVSATGGAAAGAVVINTPGTANLAGTLNGLAAVANGVGLPKQGSFELAAKNIPSFVALNAELERGNFKQSRNIHVAQGDINVTDKVTAHNVTLTTDDGNIKVAGTIDASGDKGGIVKLNAGQKANDGKGNIALATTAKINASATFDAKESAGSKGDGGKVLLNTTTDSDTTPANGSSITAEAGSEINVSGNGLGSDGKVTLRASRLGVPSVADAGNGIAITKFKSKVIGDNASIVAEGVKVYKPTDGILDDAFVSTMKADNLSYLSNATAIKAGLGLSADKRLVVASGDEVRSTGNITVANDIDLHEGGPGTLILRAKGDVNVNANISAGFTKVDEVIVQKDKKGKVISTQHSPGNLTTGGAWTYQIAAGADLNSADALATNNAGNGNFTLGADKSIRTGTGDINIATGGDFNLATATSTIYTAGEADTKDYSNLGNFTVPTLTLNYGTKSKPDVVSHTAAYTVNGGDITLESKRNINGVDTIQLPADWLIRLGSVDSSTGLYTQKGLNSDNPSWSVFYANFKENIGALGGGDINIHAGESINDLSAVIATNGRVFGTGPADGKLVVNGGGDLTVEAGGDILGGVFMVDKGVAEIRASGGLQPDAGGVKTAFAIGDAAINVATTGQLNVLTAFNPTSTSFPKLFNDAGAAAVFSTYSSKSALNLTSVASGVEVSAETPPNDLLGGNGAFVAPFNFFPSSLNIYALDGDLNFSGDKSIGLWPSALGDLTLATRNNLLINAGINMSDESFTLLPSPIKPSILADFNLIAVRLVGGSVRNTQATSSLHQADPNPVVIYAGNDILTNNATLNLSKKANITAGHDLVNLSFLGQNLAATDVTTITAGNDILYAKEGNLKWGGPGYVDITAGRNIDLGAGDGFVTRGNLDKAYLPDAGASLSVLVGAAAADDSAFIAKYLNPSKNTTYSDKVADFVKNVTSNAALTSAEAWIQFQKLDTQLQHQFVQSAFFNELKLTIDGVSKGTGTYKRGFDAIATYFPKDSYDGKLDLSFSQIKTERGGDINVMAPGGSVVIGLPKTPRQLILDKAKVVNGALIDDGTDDGLSKLQSVAASKLGMVTVKGGDVNVFSKGNIDVAQSRQFTVEGGDIVDWSSEGDIDAGKGSKTAVSAPPPRITTDAQGNTFTDLSGTATGSGIATLDTKKTTADLTDQTTDSGVDTVGTKKAKRTSNIYFGAPKGTVNAGDAGIRVAGNLSVAALRVQGADNISVSGNSSGVPPVTSVNISFNAPASASSATAGKQGDELGTKDKLGENSKMAKLLSLINVEVISIGDESLAPAKNCDDEKTKDGKNKKDCPP